MSPITTRAMRRLVPKPPSPVRIYTYLRKIDACPTINELKKVFNLNYSQMYLVMQRAVGSKLVNRLLVGKTYYFAASPGMTNPIFRPDIIYKDPLREPMTVEQLMSLFDVTPKKKPILLQKIKDKLESFYWKLGEYLFGDEYYFY